MKLKFQKGFAERERELGEEIINGKIEFIEFPLMIRFKANLLSQASENTLSG
jgi:hypothetical protein